MNKQQQSEKKSIIFRFNYDFKKRVIHIKQPMAQPFTITVIFLMIVPLSIKRKKM